MTMSIIEYVIMALLIIGTFFSLSVLLNYLFRVDKRQRSHITIIHEAPRQDDLRESIRDEEAVDEDTSPGCHKS